MQINRDLIERLRKRAEIRRSIATRKSVQEGKPDRIADLLDEAANALEAKLDGNSQERHPDSVAAVVETSPGLEASLLETGAQSCISVGQEGVE